MADDELAFLNDLTSDLLKLGRFCIDGGFKCVDLTESGKESLKNLQTIVAEIEAKSGVETEAKSGVKTPKIFSQMSPSPIVQNSSPQIQNLSSSSPQNSLSKVKRVCCSICGKLFVECFLSRHIRISHLTPSADSPNKFELERLINNDEFGVSANDFDNDVGLTDLNQKIKVETQEIKEENANNRSAILLDVLPKWPVANNKNYEKRPWKYKFGKYSRINCSICSKSIMECFFPKHSRMHERIEREKAMTIKVSCKICNRTINQRNIDSHMKLHKMPNGSSNYQNTKICKICGKRVLVCHFNRHMWGSHGISKKDRFLHGTVSKVEKVQNNLHNGKGIIQNGHGVVVKNEHGKVPNDQAKVQNEKIVTCYICMKPKTVDTIQEHFFKAHCRRDYLADGNNASLIERRQSSNADNKSDDDDFMLNSNLSTHERCNLCHEYFHKNYFNSHMKTVHDGVGFRFKCSICQSGFMRIRGCKVHIGHAHKKQGGGRALPIIAKSIKREIEDPLDNLLSLSE